MSYAIEMDNTIIHCTNPKCKATFSVIGYAYGDHCYTKVNAAKMIPLTGYTPYYCPVCGTNLAASYHLDQVKGDSSK